jgi:hypothetical protein
MAYSACSHIHCTDNSLLIRSEPTDRARGHRSSSCGVPPSGSDKALLVEYSLDDSWILAWVCSRGMGDPNVP